MRHSRKLTVLLIAATLLAPQQPAWAQKPRFEIVQEGDTELSCNALSHEASVMQSIVNNTQDIRNSSDMHQRGISVAGAAAGLLVGTVTGGIGIAAAGLLAKQASESRGDEAENLQDIAFQRRSFMLGIYKAKTCQGPIEHTLLMPVSNRDPLKRIAGIETAAGDETQQPRVRRGRPVMPPVAVPEAPAETTTAAPAEIQAEAPPALRAAPPALTKAASSQSRFND